MGGGDLNSKKSWHPNTIKNQERVWKAEQAAAEEKKRIIELQRERGEERDRAELNEMAKRSCGTSSAGDNRLHWMYEKPDKKELQEDYLLGKAIDKNEHLDKTEANIIPAVARRVVGSSMLTASEDAQVDLARKVREDPLLLVKERERAARAALLNNPLQRRKLTELLRKEQEQKKESKIKKKTSKDKDLDNILAAKLNALGGEKNIDLSALLASEDSSSDSSSERSKDKLKKKKRKHDKEKKKSKNSIKKKKCDYETSFEYVKTKNIESNDKHYRYRSPPRQKSYDLKKQSKSKRRGSVSDDDSDGHANVNKGDKRSHNVHKRSLHDSFDERQNSRKSNSSTKRGGEEYRKESKRVGPSEEERAARLAAMMAAGVEREQDRGRRVAHQRAADSAADNRTGAHQPRALLHNQAQLLPESLESRIHSNRHYIQRDRRHMNEHFARR